MDALSRATLVVASLAALGRAVPPGAPRVVSVAGASSATPGRALLAPCPPRTLPDEGVCIPVPEDVDPGGDGAAVARAGHHDRQGRWQAYDQIPRRPERSADYAMYRYPVTPRPGQNLVVSGYDLDRPDEQQRRGEALSAVGHGGIDLAAPRGTEVLVVALEHQVGDAEVVFVGTLFGTTVVTRHSVREAGELRDYVALHGHLEGAAPGVTVGASLREGTPLGYVGDSGNAGDVHLHYELRRVRAGADPRALGARVARTEHTIVCDPRNLLPLLAQ